MQLQKLVATLHSPRTFAQSLILFGGYLDELDNYSLTLAKFLRYGNVTIQLITNCLKKVVVTYNVRHLDSEHFPKFANFHN